MNVVLDHTNLHRTAKYFMDSGRAQTHDDAMTMLRGFGLSIRVGQEIHHSVPHQIALLTLVNLARRTFLDGVEVVGIENAASLTPLAQGDSLSAAVADLGGHIAREPHAAWPVAMVGSSFSPPLGTVNGWRLTWQGWRGGVTPLRDRSHLTDDNSNPLAPAIAAAACAAEAFAWHAADHAMAGRRPAGLSLWDPAHAWMENDASEPQIAYLPSRLWLIGLGNLGQAISWLLACLPYADRGQVELLLQDFDEMAQSNDSTSLLSSPSIVGQKKTRVVSRWLEDIGFRTFLEERRFGPWTARSPHDPGVALCGVDNALARSVLDKPGFELVIEAGLGAGPGGFRNFLMHSFPSSLTPDRIWGRQRDGKPIDVSAMPAYDALKKAGVGTCGLAQLASRTVGVPFVGLIAAALVVAEPLRRLHGAPSLEYVSGSTFCLDDVEKSEMGVSPYQSALSACAETAHTGPCKSPVWATFARWLSCETDRRERPTTPSTPQPSNEEEEGGSETEPITGDPRDESPWSGRPGPRSDGRRDDDQGFCRRRRGAAGG